MHLYPWKQKIFGTWATYYVHECYITSYLSLWHSHGDCWHWDQQLHVLMQKSQSMRFCFPRGQCDEDQESPHPQEKKKWHGLFFSCQWDRPLQTWTSLHEPHQVIEEVWQHDIPSKLNYGRDDDNLKKWNLRNCCGAIIHTIIQDVIMSPAMKKLGHNGKEKNRQNNKQK